MRKYEVWVEGYAITGNHEVAALRGVVDAENFDEACIKVLGDHLDKDLNQPDGYARRNGNYCEWACTCYDNEEDARRAYG